MKTTDPNILDSRRAGVLLHPTSLPNGVFDQYVFDWLDFMSDAGLSVWQMLPLGVPQSGNSPYQCNSAFAINPAFVEQSYLATAEYTLDTYQEWMLKQQHWLDDYALFASLKEQFNTQPWYEWPDAIRRRCPEALQEFREKNQKKTLAIKWTQFRLFTRWQEIRNYARKRGIYLFGDMPIFVAHDSADVWANPDYFLLDEQGQPTVVAGVPPDYFSETGQRWGNPHYHWENLKKNDFDWWIRRLESHFEWFDIVRIDHFRGLESVWEISRHCPTAIEGQWQTVPGEQLLKSVADKYGYLPLVAEDLGIITPEVIALRDKFQLPGMAVLQFSFDAFDDNPHKPKNINNNTVVYSGTHDNDTIKGWFDSLDENIQNHVISQINATSSDNIVDTMITLTLNTQANLAIIPLQDFLGLGSDARMNTPATIDRNWHWQYSPDQITAKISSNIRYNIESSGRLINV